MNRTQIEWIVNPDGSHPGWSWNPVTGCLNNCSYCYARKLANGRLKQRYLANKNIARPEILSDLTSALPKLSQRWDEAAFCDPFAPRFWEDRLDDPFLTDRNILIKRHTRGQRRTPRGIFVCDMGELFGDWVPREWQDEIHLTITCNPQHRFYLLTKQPQNLIKFNFPENCWVGVTATGDDMFNDACYYLDQIVATVKYVSVEPLLKPISEDVLDYWLQRKKLNLGQIIIGAQTKPTVYPKIEWVEEIVKACDKAGIPVFLKNNLEPLIISQNASNVSKLAKVLRKEDETILDLRLRQEIPE